MSVADDNAILKTCVKNQWQDEWNSQVNNKLHVIELFLRERESARYRKRFLCPVSTQNWSHASYPQFPCSWRRSSHLRVLWRDSHCPTLTYYMSKTWVRETLGLSICLLRACSNIPCPVPIDDEPLVAFPPSHTVKEHRSRTAYLSLNELLSFRYT